MKNYRPVSNLTFTSKVIEKVVSGRLNEHLIKNSMFDPLQLAYRDKHSTETALIKVQNDILSALDAGSSAILLMLDLSAAFDTIDHDILLSRLCNVYGITGNALDWFRSYLTGWIQRVVIENAVSGDQELDIYIAPIAQLVSAPDLVTSSEQVEGSILTAGKKLSLKNLNVIIRAIN